MSRWRRHNQIWCNWPARPIGLMEVIGGSYLSASSHITYKYLLNSLNQNGLAIHTWNYLPSLDHQAQATQAWKDFRTCKKILESRIGIGLNPIRMGHSLGCKLHLLAPDGGRNSKSSIFISFNNFNINRSIPAVSKLSSKLNFEAEFNPSSKETLRLIYQQYIQINNLIINFSNDNLDQSKVLLKCLKRREKDNSRNIELVGNHLTPISAGLRQNLLGEWAVDENKIKILNSLIEVVFKYSIK